MTVLAGYLFTRRTASSLAVDWMHVKAALPMLVTLAVPPGLFRESLQAYLQTLPAVRISALQEAGAELCDRLLEMEPDLAIIDLGPGAGLQLELVERIQRQVPQTACIYLAETMAQQELALALGAGRVLLKCLLDPELKNAILARQVEIAHPGCREGEK